MSNIIGTKGLKKANLVITQGCDLSFTILHYDQEGSIIDHSDSKLNMAIKFPFGKMDLSGFCDGDDEKILVNVSGTQTAKMPTGEYPWDIIAKLESGAVTRLVYGMAEIYDTYALDEEPRRCRSRS